MDRGRENTMPITSRNILVGTKVPQTNTEIEQHLTNEDHLSQVIKIFERDNSPKNALVVAFISYTKDVKINR